jgi:hypothetical protein
MCIYILEICMYILYLKYVHIHIYTYIYIHTYICSICINTYILLYNSFVGGLDMRTRIRGQKVH